MGIWCGGSGYCPTERSSKGCSSATSRRGKVSLSCKGAGKWVFKNKDVTAGLYTQTVEEETATGQKKIKLAWKTTSDIVEDAEPAKRPAA